MMKNREARSCRTSWIRMMIALTQHYSISDASGRALVVESNEGKAVIHNNYDIRKANLNKIDFTMSHTTLFQYPGMRITRTSSSEIRKA